MHFAADPYFRLSRSVVVACFPAEKMKKCVWVRPEVVAEIQFLQWTGVDHLRHTEFVGVSGQPTISGHGCPEMVETWSHALQVRKPRKSPS